MKKIGSQYIFRTVRGAVASAEEGTGVALSLD